MKRKNPITDPVAIFGAKWIYLKKNLQVRHLSEKDAKKAIPLLDKLINLIK